MEIFSKGSILLHSKSLASLKFLIIVDLKKDWKSAKSVILSLAIRIWSLLFSESSISMTIGMDSRGNSWLVTVICLFKLVKVICLASKCPLCDLKHIDSTLR